MTRNNHAVLTDIAASAGITFASLSDWAAENDVSVASIKEKYIADRGGMGIMCAVVGNQDSSNDDFAELVCGVAAVFSGCAA